MEVAKQGTRVQASGVRNTSDQDLKGVIVKTMIWIVWDSSIPRLTYLYLLGGGDRYSD